MLVIVRVEVRVEAVHRLGQHRVAEAKDGVRELGHDRRIDRGVVAVGARNASTFGCTLRANSSNTRCWYCISVAKLAAWNRRSPSHSSAADQPASRQCNVGDQPLVEEVRSPDASAICLRVLDLPVVLGVEDVVDGGQADVLVAAAVAGDEVRVEQLVVVGAGCSRSR